ncbi:hypothetical protein DEA98_07020 [Brucella pseudogrignonensis]|uniref:Uncharacterized protein n=1 Tax=Brucella pseudogrignonensis TaxID=419475 RepID=A0A7Y3T7R7_9HYPH|nr:hypothetical protein [Brucella pseudogrignonensis]MCM0751207.1 hypothetical protein [Brucella pseudogrignonensis]NNV22635.1 hypothetical protein [Brucella pseudogrignonensis]
MNNTRHKESIRDERIARLEMLLTLDEGCNTSLEFAQRLMDWEQGRTESWSATFRAGVEALKEALADAKADKAAAVRILDR